MALFRSLVPADICPVLRGEDVLLRVPQPGDFEEWTALREQSYAFLKPWEPTWPSDDLTRSSFRRRLKRYSIEVENDQAYPMFLFRRRDNVLVGGLTLSNVRRGVAQTCSLGYWMGAPFAGQGYMTAGVRAVLPFVFGTLRLRRIEAACLPSNLPSMRLLERVGFQREGYARRYLCIDGEWRDHVLYALLREDGWAAGGKAAIPFDETVGPDR
jgi:[ribosomal protein S5]-alanine N-acetyltransferase